MADLDGSGDDFVDMIYQDISNEGVDCSAVDMLLEMASSGSGDAGVISDVLSSLTAMGQPDWAASICRKAMTKKNSREPDYSVAAGYLGEMIKGGDLECAVQVIKFLLVPQANGYDCYDVSFILGHMVQAGHADWAGQVAYTIYMEGGQEEGGQGVAAMVPFILGTLVEFGHTDWASEICKQLMYMEGEEQVDYSVLGWCCAQMVWIGRADWAAALCDEIRWQRINWYDQSQLMDAITSWGDQSYSQTVCNFMQPGDRRPPPLPQQQRGPGSKQAAPPPPPPASQQPGGRQAPTDNSGGSTSGAPTASKQGGAADCAVGISQLKI